MSQMLSLAILITAVWSTTIFGSVFDDFLDDYCGAEAFSAFPNKTDLAFKWSMKAAAPQDECYCSASTAGHQGFCSTSDIAQGCLNKTNENYVWGMTRTDNAVFWGTVSNIACAINPLLIGEGNVCEGRDRDWRLPTAYMYDETTGKVKSIARNLHGRHFSHLNNTFGLRAAGSRNGIVVFAGPSRSFKSVFMFAFFAPTGQFLDSKEYAGFIDVRKFTQSLDHMMYVGMSRSDGVGVVMRYVGGIGNPLDFKVVGYVEGNPAELSFFQSHLMVGTWSSAGDLRPSRARLPASLLMSPGPIDAVNDEALPWGEVWSIDEYEPDKVVASSYGVSVNVEFNGWLYWGTMQLPHGGSLAFDEAYGPASTNLTAFLRDVRTRRPTTLFRGRNFGGDRSAREVELLYGQTKLPSYADGYWRMTANNMGCSPKYGPAGFGNFFNSYTWSMTNVRDKYLLIGTFDTSAFQDVLNGGINGHDDDKDDDDVNIYIDDDVWDDVIYTERLTEAMAAAWAPVKGADLFVMRAEFPVDRKGNGTEGSMGVGPAEWVSKDGLGSELNFGIRNLVGDPKGLKGERNVFAGTASAYNLKPNGGWKVYELDCPE